MQRLSWLALIFIALLSLWIKCASSTTHAATVTPTLTALHPYVLLNGGRVHKSRRNTSDSLLRRLWSRLQSLFSVSSRRGRYLLSRTASTGKSKVTKHNALKPRSRRKDNQSTSTPDISSPNAKRQDPSAKGVANLSGTTRIYREIESFIRSPPDNLRLTVDEKNIRSWTVTLVGARGSVYAGEQYKLRMTFPKDYPSKPPSVYFLKPVPRHVHVYSNGDICLNLLGKGWSPILTGEALALSILSMLSSAREKGSPQDGTMLSDAPPGRQQDNWMYHDDRC